MFTHRERSAKQGAEFFARVAYRVVHKGMKPSEAIDDVAKDSPQFVKDKVKQAKDKVKEALDPNSALSKEEFADDLALTSMARLWDVGKTEPIKVRNIFVLRFSILCPHKVLFQRLFFAFLCHRIRFFIRK